MLPPTKERTAIPRLVIAAPSSGQGKTTATLAITMLLKEAGYKVVTFKCGPDYLDPTWHEKCSGSPCYNLDSWMMGSEEVKQTFARYAVKGDIAIIEGVMGLYDGAHPRKDTGSTAEIAKILGAPVVLVLTVRGMARSCAALVHGFASYDSAIQLKGVLCNGVGSENHQQLLESVLGHKLFLGGLIHRKEATIPARHLGLYPAEEHFSQESWSGLFQSPPKVEKIIALASHKVAPLRVLQRKKIWFSRRICRIGVAKDAAFFFLYRQNLDFLEEFGAELLFFSPLQSKSLPDVQALYFPGGYPELHALDLSQNLSLIEDIRHFAEKKRPIYAECGGLMYLMKTLETRDGSSYSMVGLLEGTSRMEKTRQALGYVEVETQKETLLGSKGTRFRGHQFRYSRVVTQLEANSYRVRRPNGKEAFYEGFTQARILASYIHGHWASNPQIARSFVMACR